MTNNNVTYFGEANFRPPRFTKRFGIKQADRLSHLYIIGKTGTGKSTLLETLVTQDMQCGNGLAFFDPHGDSIESLFAHVPESRRKDVIYLNVADNQEGYGYNPLRYVTRDRRSLAASGMIEVLSKMFGAKNWGARMEHVLRFSLLALLETKDATISQITRMLTDKDFRRGVVLQIRNPQVHDFWTREFPQYAPRMQSDVLVPIANKLSAFLAHPNVYEILNKPKNPIHLRKIMDEGKILLVNLAKGTVGSDVANTLGAFLISTIGLAAFSRAEMPKEDRRDFFCYADEFQNFTTLSFADMLSELRKYGVGMVLANQYLFQMERDIRESIIGNCGTLISFRLGARDAGFFEKECQPELKSFDFLTLPNYNIYLKLMIDGAPSLPFSARTLLPEEGHAT